MGMFDKTNGKIIQTDYDRLIGMPYSDDENLYCLKDVQVAAILATVEYMHWISRWFSLSGIEIDQKEVNHFASDLSRRLMMPCNCGDGGGDTTVYEYRLNTTNYYWERNDGTGWVTDPNDPRTNPVNYPPNAGTNDKCQASKNAFNQLVEAAAQCWTFIEAGTTLVQAAASIAAVLIILVTRPTDAYWLIPVVLQFIAEIKDYELVAFVSQFTTVYAEPLRESLYCHINNDLTYDDNGLAGIISDMEAIDFTLGGVNLALPTIEMILYCWQAGGLTNAATLLTSPVTPGECDNFSCAGCHVENWIIRYPETGHFGEVVATNSGEGYIDVQSTGINTNNKYYIYIQTTNPSVQGCAIHGIEVLEGTVSTTDPYGTRAYNVIDDYNLEHFAIFPSPICVNCLQWSNDTPFKLRIRFDPCA